ncbi:hypothetical protein B0E41_22170 [Hydrogenophaga sp. A37]|nr:hypothetical protein B0E41_22170 [Hydrogenophaga sp. A37]
MRHTAGLVQYLVPQRGARPRVVVGVGLAVALQQQVIVAHGEVVAAHWTTSVRRTAVRTGWGRNTR